MSKKTKSFLLNLISFVLLFIAFRYLVTRLLSLSEIFTAVLTFVLVIVFSPKFQALRTRDGEKLFMNWIFIKGVREIS